MLLIGSRALRHRNELRDIEAIKTIILRESSDIDFIATMDEITDWANKRSLKYFVPADKGKKIIAKEYSTILEFEIAWSDRTASELIRLVQEDPETKEVYCYNVQQEVLVPSLDVLYMLKMSHRYLRNSPHFFKTMSDIYCMRRAGAKIPERYQEWYKKRMKETYDYKHPNLSQSKDNFFNPEEVKYIYDHDSIHRVMAHLDVPAYTLFQRDGAEVAVDKEKWDGLPHLTKLYSVLEESLVLALERSQIPYPEADPDWSFKTALEKCCTSIASGWWREFAWENYYQVLSLYEELDKDYVQRFWKAVEEGRVPLAE